MPLHRNEPNKHPTEMNKYQLQILLDCICFIHPKTAPNAKKLKVRNQAICRKKVCRILMVNKRN